MSRPASALGAASIASSSASSSRHSSNDELPSHVTRAIASLQREVVLLRNELNFELWLSRENVQHVGRLYQERSLSNNAEVERQGLVRILMSIHTFTNTVSSTINYEITAHKCKVLKRNCENTRNKRPLQRTNTRNGTLSFRAS